MIYDSGKGEFEGWILKEEKFDPEFPEKGESIMCLGNGYMGVRSAMEEFVCERSRGHLVAGTFDLIEGDDATELPNLPDVTNMKITFDGEEVSPTGKISDFERTINLKNGLLRRTYTWESSSGKRLNLEFLRMVSLSDLHLICAKVNLTACDGGEIVIESGIDGNVKKKEHLEPYGINAVNDVLNLTCASRQSNILFSTMTLHKFEVGGVSVDADCSIQSDDERRITAVCGFSLNAGQTLSITKISNVFTSRDMERDGCDMGRLVSDAREHMKSVRCGSFEEFLAASAAEWEKRIWSLRDVKIKSENVSDALAVRFAIYHLTAMAPVHDNRMNIGAKGLSGLGYRGHTFWDTEIFMLPYFVFAAPDEAASLIEYRYNCLEAARKNAAGRGFEGAMFPWEAAWITDGETTPTWCLTGLMEYHITADVALGVYNYYIVTGDEEFMEKYGYELIFDTAKFWASRLEYNAELNRYEICHVIGPNEYKEDVNNNAYTNYLARCNIQLAIKYADELKERSPEIFARLDGALGIDKVYPVWLDRVDKIYLPRENDDGLVPEDDTFLTLPDITREDCTISEMAREAHEIAGKMGGVGRVMVGKQADVMLLMFLMEDLFSAETKKKNYYFYEKRCFHDSSLSLSTYSALAADLGEKETAYRMFERASMIDMGPAMWSSVEGVHSASLGGIWQCCVFGFAGVRRYGETLRIEPHLPDEWEKIEFAINWHGQRLEISVTHSELCVSNVTGSCDVEFLNGGSMHRVGDGICLKYGE